MSFVTRIAPSPTGMMHLGTARTAYFCWLAARASGGKMILRIDDTDLARHDEDAVKVIYDAMNWLGLDYDLTARQSDRLDIYRDRIDILAGVGKAVLDDGAWKLKIDPALLPDGFYDNAKRGNIKITDHDKKLIDGLVLVRSDGMPTYHFASCVDDALMNVNYVIRGTDHLPNTAKHIAIWTAMGTPIPKFAHVGLIHVNDVDGKRKKLSKRDAAASLLSFRDDGVDPAALLNYLLRLGWSPSDANFDRHTPMIDKTLATSMFLTDGKMRDSPVLFDSAKLASLNRLYKRHSEHVGVSE